MPSDQRPFPRRYHVNSIFRAKPSLDGLSGLQRDTLGHVKALEEAGQPVNVRTFSAQARCTYASAQNRLATLAVKGRLRIIRPGIAGVRPQEYGSAQVRPIGDASPRTVWRDGVKVVICPPAHATGALIWGSSLGRGRPPGTKH